MRQKLLIFGGIIILMLLGLAIFTRLHSSPTQSVADKFVGYVLQGKSSESYALFSDSAKNSQNEATWNTTVTELSSFFKGVKPHYSDTVATSDGTAVDYNLQRDATTYRFQLIIVKDANGTQKVFSFLSELASASTTTNQGSSAKANSGSSTSQ